MNGAVPALRIEAAPKGPLIFSDDRRTAYVVAGGASILDEPLDRLPPAATVAVTDAWRLVPNAAVLYAADIEWYYVHRDAIAAGFAGERWCAWLDAPARAIRDECGDGEEAAVRARLVRSLRLRSLPWSVEAGLSPKPGLVHLGGVGRNSGVQAVGYARQWGARRIVLVGVDLGGERYIGEQHASLRHKHSDYTAFRASFEALVRDLVGAGVVVVNCSPVSHIEGATHLSLAEALP